MTSVAGKAEEPRTAGRTASRARLSVLVTGASSGIGRATAVAFARRGHKVFAAARRTEALNELAGGEPGIVPVTLDVTDAGSVRAAWAAIQDATAGAGVDVLANVAGFALAGPVEALSDADVRRQFDTNVFGLLAMSRTVLPGMRERGSGRIINVSSLVGRVTFGGMGVYGATKYAVEALSDALRQEVAPFGVRVVIIEPGWVATSIGESADANTAAARQPPAAYADMVARGDRYLAAQVAKGIAPEQVAAAIVKAAEAPSPRARYAVPLTARLLIPVLTTLPDKLADWAKARATTA
jgi:NADP-dependent 3-hydroxy acid dehydrogenase YdfG